MATAAAKATNLPRRNIPRRLVLAWTITAAVGLAVYALHFQFTPANAELNHILDTWLGDALDFMAPLACFLRAGFVRRDRLAWALIGAGLAIWGCGDVLYDSVYHGNPPYPSYSDACYLAMYPLCYAGLALLIRRRISRFNLSLALDGVMAALAVGALGAAITFQLVLEHSDGQASMLLTNLAYPLGDTLLIALVVGMAGMAAWRPGRSWTLAGIGFGILAVVDSMYMITTAVSTYTEGTLMDALWPAGLLLVGAAALQDVGPAAKLKLEGRPVLVTPIVCGLTATGILFLSRIESLNPLAVTLACLTVLTVIARTAVSLHENTILLETVRAQSLTDSLTGLGNRRKLMSDLEHALDPHGVRGTWLIAVFDLNGFKHYNDTFGHPAGDAMLATFAGRLRQTIDTSGSCYRLGGDEFCVVANVEPAATERLISNAVEALTERGDGFKVSTAFGAVFVPDEASDPEGALRLADQRLYAQKNAGLARLEPRGLLTRALAGRPGHMREDQSTVADLAASVGLLLSLTPNEIEELRLAAELHDIGKLAMPDTILDSPDSLTKQEREFVEQHTIIGERILAGLPVLHSVGQIVRASHERWDGNGYGDGVGGDEIPLASRIIAVCDAYAAMTEGRPYRAAMTPADAVAELQRCSGTQFDPTVVELFCRHMATAAARHPAVV